MALSRPCLVLSAFYTILFGIQVVAGIKIREPAPSARSFLFSTILYDSKE